MPPLAEHCHASAEESAAQLALHVADLLKKGIKRDGAAFLAVSGGSTPVLLFEALGAMALPWHKVTIAQVDERWVEPGSSDSNQYLIRRHLIGSGAGEARFVPMYNGAANARDGQASYEPFLQQMTSPFDAILLGMGEDGHTASLFPGAAQLRDGLEGAPLCLAVTPPAARHERLSLSLAGLLRSRVLILQLRGAAKERVYRLALAAGPVEAMPVRAVLRQEQVPVEVWISG